MAVNTYSTLKLAMAAWLDRTDLSVQLPNFIELAEADIRTDVRVQAMEQYTSGTLDGETLDHPDRYLEARRLTVGGTVYRYVSPEVYAAAVESNATQAIYTTIGQVFYILGAESGDEYTLIYYQSFSSLSGESDTNWLLTNYPNVYLFAACKHAGTFLDDDMKTSKYTALYQDAVGRLVSREKSSASSGGALVMRATTRE